jgi:type II secretory pathway pseudopilin PulG
MRGGSAKPLKQKSAGFTIVELLIATMIFSTIIVLVSVVVVRISNQFYKTLTLNKTQTVARAISDAVAQGIQFSNAGITSDHANDEPGMICAGNQVFVYQRHLQILGTGSLAPDQTRHAVLQATAGVCPTYETTAASWLAAPPSNARELLDNKMRLAKFTIQQSSSNSDVYNIDIKVVYGDTDLLCSPSSPNHDCNPDVSQDSTTPNKDDVQCKIGPGSQFCAISELNTTVEKRLN